MWIAAWQHRESVAQKPRRSLVLNDTSVLHAESQVGPSEGGGIRRYMGPASPSGGGAAGHSRIEPSDDEDDDGLLSGAAAGAGAAAASSEVIDLSDA